MIKIKVFIISILILLISGCYDYRELTELALISGIAIDKKDNQYSLTIQVIDTKKNESNKGSSSAGGKVINYTSTGKTLKEAQKRINFDNPKFLYFPHFEILVVSEEIAKEGLLSHIDYFIRDSSINEDFVVILSKEKTAKEILEVLTPLRELPALKISRSLNYAASEFGNVTIVKLDQILSDILAKGIDPVLPAIKVKGKKSKGKDDKNLESIDPDTKILISNLAMFNGDKFAGYLTEKEGIAYNMVRNNLENTIINTECSKGKEIAVNITGNKAANKFKLIKDKPTIKITINLEGTIGDTNCKINLANQKNIKKIEKKVSKNIKKMVNKAIKSAEKADSDIFGLTEIIYKSNYKYYKSNKKNLFKKIKTEVKVNVLLSAKGRILTSLKESNDEK